MAYWVYILASKPGGTLYVGVTDNLIRRVYEHREGLAEGFTKRYGIKMLVYFEQHDTITAAAVAHAITVLPRPPAGWIVAGGGTRNPTLMRMLAQRLAPAQVETAGAVGWSADALEAQAFAYLAVRTLKGLPLTFPPTTGAPRPLTGGILARP